jgi:hypothetical protein
MSRRIEWPYDLATPMRRVQKHYRLLRQPSGRGRFSTAKVALDCDRWIFPFVGGERTPDEINAATEILRTRRGSTKPRVAEGVLG